MTPEPVAGNEWIQFSVRIATTLRQRCENHRQKLQAESRKIGSTISVSFTDAIVSLLELGLEQVERRDGGAA
jgi:hypothetical protein